MSDDPDILAAQHAIGVLEGDVRAGTQARVARDSAFAARVEQWVDRLGTLAACVATADPPAGLLDRIEAEIDRIESAPPANTATLRREDGEWRVLAEGVECRLLFHNSATARQTLLLRMAPGARYETHHHDDVEECYVISGDLAFGAHELRPGDFHVGLPGSDHPPATTREGCLLLISAAA